MLEYKSIPFEIKGSRRRRGRRLGDRRLRLDLRRRARRLRRRHRQGRLPGLAGQAGPKHLYEHGEPIGKTLEIREDDKGLVGRWSIVDTQAGTDAYKLAKAGVLDSSASAT
jgi:hypothetical protein